LNNINGVFEILWRDFGHARVVDVDPYQKHKRYLVSLSPLSRSSLGG